MSKIQIQKQHNLNDDELRSIAEEIGSKLVSKFGGGTSWDGDRLNYSLPGTADAFVEWDASTVSVNVKLGMMASMLKSVISKEIERELVKHV